MKTLCLIVALFLLGCAEDPSKESCYDKIADLIAKRGEAEEVVKYDSGDYHSWTFWYWSDHTAYTFTWGVDGCNVSKYAFREGETYGAGR